MAGSLCCLSVATETHSLCLSCHPLSDYDLPVHAPWSASLSRVCSSWTGHGTCRWNAIGALKRKLANGHANVISSTVLIMISSDVAPA